MLAVETKKDPNQRGQERAKMGGCLTSMRQLRQLFASPSGKRGEEVPTKLTMRKANDIIKILQGPRLASALGVTHEAPTKPNQQVGKDDEQGVTLGHNQGSSDSTNELTELVATPRRHAWRAHNNRERRVRGEVSHVVAEKVIRLNLLREVQYCLDETNAESVNMIIYNDLAHIVAVFKEFLIYDDVKEFIHRYYPHPEATTELTKLVQASRGKFTPSYALLEERSIFAKGAERKDKVLKIKVLDAQKGPEGSTFLRTQYMNSLAKEDLSNSQKDVPANSLDCSGNRDCHRILDLLSQLNEKDKDPDFVPLLPLPCAQYAASPSPSSTSPPPPSHPNQNSKPHPHPYSPLQPPSSLHPGHPQPLSKERPPFRWHSRAAPHPQPSASALASLKTAVQALPTPVLHISKQLAMVRQLRSKGSSQKRTTAVKPTVGELKLPPNITTPKRPELVLSFSSGGSGSQKPGIFSTYFKERRSPRDPGGGANGLERSNTFQSLIRSGNPQMNALKCAPRLTPRLVPQLAARRNTNDIQSLRTELPLKAPQRRVNSPDCEFRAFNKAEPTGAYSSIGDYNPNVETRSPLCIVTKHHAKPIPAHKTKLLTVTLESRSPLAHLVPGPSIVHAGKKKKKSVEQRLQHVILSKSPTAARAHLVQAQIPSLGQPLRNGLVLSGQKNAERFATLQNSHRVLVQKADSLEKLLHNTIDHTHPHHKQLFV